MRNNYKYIFVILTVQNIVQQYFKMNFASVQVKKKLKQVGQATEGRPIKAPIIHFQNKNKQKYRQCLKMVQEWSQSLLQRQNSMRQTYQKLVYGQQQRQKQNKLSNNNSLNMNRSNIHAKSSNNGNMKTSTINNAYSQIDIEEIISKQFIKKMQNLYMKQFMLRDFDDDSINIKDKSIQDHTFSDMDYL